MENLPANVDPRRKGELWSVSELVLWFPQTWAVTVLEESVLLKAPAGSDLLNSAGFTSIL